MNKSTKNLLKSITVLSVIALVCVAILSFANVFLKTEPTLDMQMVKFLNENFATSGQTATGVDSETAYEQDYFVMLTNTELSNATGNTYKSFKSNASNYVGAIYYAQKGASEGTFYIESSSTGYKNMLTVVVAFTVENNDFLIQNVAVKELREDFLERKTQVFNSETFKKYVEQLKSDPDMSISFVDFKATTKVTTEKSFAGLNRAVTRAVETMSKIYAKADDIKTEIGKRGEQNG